MWTHIYQHVYLVFCSMHAHMYIYYIIHFSKERTEEFCFCYFYVENLFVDWTNLINCGCRLCVFRPVQLQDGEKHQKLHPLSLCPPSPSLQRHRGREAERGKGVQIRRGRGQRFLETGKRAALQQLGVGSAWRKETEEAEERGKERERERERGAEEVC